MAFRLAYTVACAVAFAASFGAPLSARADERPIAQMRWRSIGPALPEGRASAVVGSDRNPLLYYAGFADAGVWKSIDGGTSWQNISDAIHLGSVGAIAVGANDERNVWVGAGETNPRNDVIPESGLYHSIDGGRTWQRHGLYRAPGISKILWILAIPSTSSSRCSATCLRRVRNAAFTSRSTAAPRLAKRCTCRSSPARATWQWIRRIPTLSTPACGTCCAVRGR